jgi:hypothetical protein
MRVVPDHSIVILGIPIPSSAPVFLAIVAVHVLASLGCLIAGLIAMFSVKRRGRHPFAGTAYYYLLAMVFASMSVLSYLQWPEDAHLFFLGVLSFAAATIGRAARRAQWRGWLSYHVSGMGSSYILLLTAFYLDNGPNLPLWRNLPSAAYWIAPSIVGLPILIRALLRHPLVVQQRRENL